jgi:hypothetical protein
LLNRKIWPNDQILLGEITSGEIADCGLGIGEGIAWGIEHRAGGDNCEFRISNCEFEKAQGRLEKGEVDENYKSQ